MSDGNFNRSLLPSGGYASGVRAGESRMRVRAARAFRRWLAETCPRVEPGELDRHVSRFAALMAED
ncbi:MAG: hypothetical protein IJ659_05405 [Alloprevotella sp.]|nr:hypothetical protein [Alloprevotella sp.]